MSRNTSSTTISNGGNQYVERGGIAIGDTLNGGLETVSTGATDVGARINGGEQDLYGNGVERGQVVTPLPVIGFVDNGSADASTDRVREFRKRVKLAMSRART
jgi:autotransporter passenger strand-loop-strand repeat protein